MNETQTTYVDESERLRRWRLILGKDAENSPDGLGGLSGASLKIDEALQLVYNCYPNYGLRIGGLENSSPKVQRWLGDIRTYFPKSVVQIVQRDAFERLGLNSMLTEPELLETLEVDVNLVATLLSLSKVIPDRTKQTARFVVKKLVDQLMKRLAAKTIAAVRGSLNRAARTNRPRQGELDFDRTIRRNLKNWNVEQKKLLADRFVGYARKRKSLREVVLCVDESGSMGRSVVYSSIFGAVLASIPSIKTRLVLFDTNVVDLTDRLSDPVEALFGAQLGGGTNINRALEYCQKTVTQPKKTIFILISDLCEGGDVEQTFARAEALIQSGVKFICLVALDDSGAHSYDQKNAKRLAELGVPTFACSPDLFPDLMGTAINGGDIARWAGRNDVTLC